jgi:hypothetical protein
VVLHHTAYGKIATNKDKVMKSFAFANFYNNKSTKNWKPNTVNFMTHPHCPKISILGENIKNRSKQIQLYLSSYLQYENGIYHFEIYMTRQFI